VIEDLPSLIHPTTDDHRAGLLPTPRVAATDSHVMEPDAAPLAELCSVTDDVSDVLVPSPLPSQTAVDDGRLPVELDSEAMIALRRLACPAYP